MKRIRSCQIVLHFVILLAFQLSFTFVQASSFNEVILSSKKITQLLKSKKRPTMDDINTVFAEEGWLEPAQLDKIQTLLISKPGYRQKLSYETLEMYGLLEVLYPGYQLSSLGRDAVVATEIFDALMIEAGSSRRGIRIDMSGDIARTASKKDILNYLFSIGFPKSFNQLQDQGSIFVLDWTSWTESSQLKRIVEFLYSHYMSEEQGLKAQDIEAHLNAIVPGGYSPNLSFVTLFGNLFSSPAFNNQRDNNLYQRSKITPSPIRSAFNQGRNSVWHGRFTHFLYDSGTPVPFIGSQEEPTAEAKLNSLLEMVEIFLLAKNPDVIKSLNGYAALAGEKSFYQLVRKNDSQSIQAKNYQIDVPYANELRLSMETWSRIDENKLNEILNFIGSLGSEKLMEIFADGIWNQLVRSLQKKQMYNMQLTETILGQFVYQKKIKPLSQFFIEKLFKTANLKLGLANADDSSLSIDIEQGFEIIRISNLVALGSQEAYLEYVNKIFDDFDKDEESLKRIMSRFVKNLNYAIGMGNRDFIINLLKAINDRLIKNINDQGMNSAALQIWSQYIHFTLRVWDHLNNSDKKRFYEIFAYDLAFSFNRSWSIDDLTSIPVFTNNLCLRGGFLTELCVHASLNKLWTSVEKLEDISSSDEALKAYVNKEITYALNSIWIMSQKNSVFYQKLLKQMKGKDASSLIIQAVKIADQSQVRIPGLNKDQANARWTDLINYAEGAGAYGNQNNAVIEIEMKGLISVAAKSYLRSGHYLMNSISLDFIDSRYKNVDDEVVLRIVNAIYEEFLKGRISILLASEIITKIYNAKPSLKLWSTNSSIGSLVAITPEKFKKLTPDLEKMPIERRKFVLSSMAQHPQTELIWLNESVKALGLIQVGLGSYIDILKSFITYHRFNRKKYDRNENVFMHAAGGYYGDLLEHFALEQIRLTDRSDWKELGEMLFDYYIKLKNDRDPSRSQYSHRESSLRGLRRHNYHFGEAADNLAREDRLFEIDALSFLSDFVRSGVHSGEKFKDLTRIAKRMSINKNNGSWYQHLLDYIETEKVQKALLDIINDYDSGKIKIRSNLRKNIDVELIKKVLLSPQNSSGKGRCELQL